MTTKVTMKRKKGGENSSFDVVHEGKRMIMKQTSVAIRQA